MNNNVTDIKNSDNEENVINEWLEGVKTRDVDKLLALLDENIALNPPFQTDKVFGRGGTLKTLRAFDQVVDNFSYQRTFTSKGAVILEFKGVIDGMELQGVDLFTINDDLKIQSIEVMARPLAAVQALGKAIKRLS